MNRREMLAAIGAAGLGMAGGSAWGQTLPKAIIDGLRIFDVRTYGAIGDGKAMDSGAINRAVEACSSAGGGIVYVGPGTYLCGTVVLKSNVTFYLEATAVIQGSPRSEDFTLMPGPPEEGDANQRHLIFARDAENITITGMGRIDGNGDAFWTKKASRQVKEEWGDVATYDYVASRRRSSPLLEFYNVRNLRVERVRITNASGWTLRPMNCTDVFIDGITIRNKIYGLNTDGIDATGCTNLFISNCNIHTADDCICLKSENAYGEPVAVSKNIVVTNCVLSCCCNGLKFGTATHGGYENVVVSNCTFQNDAGVPTNQKMISAIAVEMVDGGYVDGVTISNVKATNVRCPIFLRRGNRREPADLSRNYLRNVMISNLHATGSIMTSSIGGLPGRPVEDVSLSDISIESAENGKAEWAEREIPEVPKAYPEARMYGRMPAYGLYARHVAGLRVRGLELRCEEGEGRPAVVMDDVRGASIMGLAARMGKTSKAVVEVRGSRDVTLNGCSAPKAEAFLDVDGKSSDVAVLASDLRRAKVVAVGDGAGAVAQAGCLTS